MSLLARWFSSPPSLNGAQSHPYRCPRQSCGSSDVVYGRAVERLVPGPGAPARVVVGHDVVCNRCGHAYCVTRDEVYTPAIGYQTERERNVQVAAAAEPTAHPRWPKPEP